MGNDRRRGSVVASTLACALALAAAGCGPRAAHAPRTAPYGTWTSPITAEMAAEGVTDLLEPEYDDAGNVTWLSPQPDGALALVRRTRGGAVERLVPDAEVYSEAHAYGGGAVLVDGTRLIYSDGTTHALVLADGGARTTLVPASPGWFVDCAIDRPRDRLICVHDDPAAGAIPVDSLVAIPLAGGAPRPLAGGHDFFAQPRVSPDGSRLAYLTWELPRLPWDGTELWVAPIAADGSLGAATRIAGGERESIHEAQWSPGGELYFTSDRTGFWNLYRVPAAGGAIAPVWPVDAEVGLAAWELDVPMFAFASPSTLVAAAVRGDRGELVTIELPTGAVARVPTPFDVMRGGLRVHDGRAIMLAGSPREPISLVEVELATGATEVIARESNAALPPAFIAAAEAFTFPTADGAVGHAFYHPPTHPGFRAPAGERPPLVVRAHGGPTGRFDHQLNPEIYYWTSRGFAVASVNYGGSVGHGRAYRERLNGQWGVVDVDDCIAAARALVARGKADGDRLLVRGGSAGGYTTLAAVAFRDVFRAGASWFGIGDIAAMDAATVASDKLESGYTKMLIGTDPALIRARSPLYSADRIRAPVIFFQGADDPVVPAEQSRTMFAALKSRGIATAYIEFPGEKHGFRKLEHNARAFRAELYFYRRVLGLPADDDPPPVEIVGR